MGIVFILKLVRNPRSRTPLVFESANSQGQKTRGFGEGSSNGLRVGDLFRTDDQGYVTISVPALGDFSDRFTYHLEAMLPNSKDSLFPVFKSALPGEVDNIGQVIFNIDADVPSSSITQ